MRELLASKVPSWLRALLAGAFVAFLTVEFIFQSVYILASSATIFLGWELSRPQLDSIAPHVSGWGVYVCFLFLTVFLASWVARAAEKRFLSHGLLVGVVAAAGVLLFIQVRFPPVELYEAFGYPALGALGGYLGTRRGRGEKVKREAFYKASRAISEASDPREVVEAVGEHLRLIGVEALGLWRPALVSESGVDGYEPWVSWPLVDEHLRGSMWLDITGVPALEPLENRRAVLLRAAKLPMLDGGEAWLPSNARAAWFVPLFASSEAPVGLLVVVLRGSGHAFSGSEREYLAVGAQASLALENMRLAQEAREAGEEIGVLRAQKRFSHELHDTLAQNFQSIVRTLGTVLRPVPHEEQDGIVPEGLQRRPVELALSMAREGAEEARRMIWALRTIPGGPHALGEALKKLVERWSEEAGIEGCLVASGDPCPLSPETKVTLFRATQEALNNVRKHALASRVGITLSYTEELVALHVRDDGRGFEIALLPETFPEPGPRDEGGFGLHGMRERVEQLGGTLLVESAPEQGTTLTVVLPISTSDGGSSENGEGLSGRDREGDVEAL